MPMMLPRLIARKWIKLGMHRMIAEGNSDAITATTATVASASNKAWRNWLNRYDAALARVEPFTEPALDEIGQ